REQFIPRVPARTPKSKARPHPAAVAPAPASATATGDDRVSQGAPSDAEIRAQLRELYGQAGGKDPGSARTVALSRGLATAPPDAPDKVQRIVAAANQVARLPYVYGGG